MPQTKIRVPPARQAWVRRDVLLDRLQSADTPLLLVRAPAGYGKSTLLSQLAHQSEDQVVGWVELENSENDPVLFWRCVLAALRRASPGFAETAWVEVSGPAPSLTESVVPRLVNELVDVPDPVLLVLDDYQLITNPTVHATMQFVLAHLPRSTQIAIGSRSAPGFSLSRMRTNHMMTEITSRDLAFSDREIGEAIRRVGWDDPEAAVADIRAQTEGWPAGVYLATLGGPHRAMANRGVAAVTVRDYLMDEMLDGRSAEEREFLRKTSILERFSGDLCDHVTGRSHSSELLAGLASSNLLLIPLDDEGEWFRYHHLLRDVLQGQLMRTNPDQVPRLHLLASGWLADNGSPSEAIHHAIGADDLVLAAELVCVNFWDFYSTGRFATTELWIDRFPDRTFSDFPPLAVVGALVAAFGGNRQSALHLCALVDSVSFAGPTPEGHSSFESYVALLRCGLYPDGVADARENGRLAYALEPPTSPWRGFAAAAYGSALLASGDHESAFTYLTEAASTPDPTIVSYANGQLAVLSVWEEDWDQADRYVSEALAAIGQNGLERVVTSAPAFAAGAATAARAGNLDLVRKHSRSMAAAMTTGYPDAALEVAILAAETSLHIGDINAAARHARAGAAALEVLGDGGYYAGRLADVTAGINQAEPSPASIPAPEELTTREQQVLSLLPSELTARQIGERLYISRNTVKTHTGRIYRKLEVSERHEAVARARELGLLPQASS